MCVGNSFSEDRERLLISLGDNMRRDVNLLDMSFSTSSTKTTGNDNQRIATHSFPVKAVTVKTAATGGVYKMNTCSSIETAIAAISHRLLQGGN